MTSCKINQKSPDLVRALLVDFHYMLLLAAIT
jgi:hypothetical protein